MRNCAVSMPATPQRLPQRLSLSPLAAAVAVMLGSLNMAHAQQAPDAEPTTSSAADPLILPNVTISGAAPSANTENLQSYTTGQTSAATRLPLSLRQTPQAVTVMTRQRMEDQHLDSLQDVLINTTGISAYQTDSQRTSFYSRGMLIDNLQYDGVPTAVGSIIDGSGISALDTASYDRVEVVRGANGLMTGTGNPSAAINLVRKRPTDVFSANSSFSVGRWDSYRGMGDVSSPLTQDGSVRARLVGTYDDAHSYIDGYKPQKQTVYGTIEADLTPDTTLRLGYDDVQSNPNGATWGGLPLWYSDGSQASYSRSKTFAQQWSYWDSSYKTAFFELEQRFDNDWKIRSVFNQYRTRYDAQLLGLVGNPERNTGLGTFPSGAYPVALAASGHSRQITLDVMASGPFTLGGREHELVIGAMGSRRTEDKDEVAPFYASVLPQNIYDLDSPFSKPDFAGQTTTATATTLKQGGLYSTARFSLADRWHLIVGGRFISYEVDESVTGTANFHYKKASEFTPYAGLVYDIDDTYSVYGSYTGVFNPQSSYRDRNGNVLTPTEGSNREIGLKGEYLGGRLNASIALFDTKLENAAQTLAGIYTPSGAQAYQGVDGTTSRGVELDVQGELTRGWNLSAGVANFTATDGDGVRLNSQVPRTTAQLFTTYQLPGEWQKLTVGGGTRWQSRIYQSPGVGTSTLGGEQQSYALVSLMARYAINRQVDLHLNVENLLDRKYALQKGDFDTVTYGEPRNLVATVSYRY